MLTTTRAIVLNTTKYGDRKLFVNMFTKEYGMMSFSCSSGGRGRSSSKMNLFQPLNILEVGFDLKPKSEIHTLQEVRIDFPASGIPFDAYKLSISLFLAEFLRYALMNEQSNPMLFDYIVQSIEWLDAAEKEFSNFHIVFMVKLSTFIGFHPNLEDYYPGAWFDLREGSFSPLVPTHKDTVRPADATIIHTLSRLSFATMHLLKLSRRDRNICTETVLKYYSLHLPTFPELRSFAILKELFA